MRRVRALIVSGIVMVLAGCATTVPIRYTLSQPAPGTTPLPYRLVVGVWHDARPELERVQPKRSFWSRSFAPQDQSTSDRRFPLDVPKQLAQSLATHLERMGRFQHVTVQPVSETLEHDPQALEALAREGVDLVITGRLTHFTGFRSGMNPAGMMFGALGVLAETVANPKRVSGHVAYQPLTVIDVRRRRVLWRGDVEARFEERKTFYEGAATYALQALRQANEQAVRHIDEAAETLRATPAETAVVP